MASPLFSTLLGDAAQWDNPDPYYTLLMTKVGHADHADCLNSNSSAVLTVNLAQRSPVAIAFIVEGDDDHVHVGHSPSIYPADPSNASPYDNLVVVLVGDDVNSAIPVVLPAISFARVPDLLTLDFDQVIGAAGFGAAPPVFRFGPHPAGTANTTQLRARRVCLMPCSMAAQAVSTQPGGRYTLPAFHDTFIRAGLAATDIAVRTPAEILRDWVRVAVTNNNVGRSTLAIAPIAAGIPATQVALNRWVTKIKDACLIKLGAGGPALSSAAFNTGVAAIQSTLDNNATNRLQFERDRKNQSFTDKHGDHLAQRLYHLCGCVDDAGLPEVHQLLAKAPKGRDYAILSAMFNSRAGSSEVPLTTANPPLATTKLTEEVFRSFAIAGTGLTFAAGLTPFAVVCEGHAESATIASMTKKAELAEAGTTMTLADASRLVSTDVRFPTSPQVAAEKLYGWSVVIDVFHGINHDVSRAVRNFVIEVGPALHRAYEQYAATPALGMDIVNRILYEAQQEYFVYVTDLAAGLAPRCPTFSSVIGAVRSFRFGSLSDYPSSWLVLLPAGSRPSPASEVRASPRHLTGSVATFNPNADQRLLARFEASPHNRVSDMMSGHDVAIPKHDGKDVCLVWALKGQCSTNCARKNQHVRYSRDTIAKIHSLMDECGVANSQP